MRYCAAVCFPLLKSMQIHYEYQEPYVGGFPRTIDPDYSKLGEPPSIAEIVHMVTFSNPQAADSLIRPMVCVCLFSLQCPTRYSACSFCTQLK